MTFQVVEGCFICEDIIFSHVKCTPCGASFANTVL